MPPQAAIRLRPRGCGCEREDLAEGAEKRVAASQAVGGLVREGNPAVGPEHHNRVPGPFQDGPGQSAALSTRAAVRFCSERSVTTMQNPAAFPDVYGLTER